ncbi:hypothetical protein DXG03_002171 [Asterophora parasitica]|uniref:Nucleoporin Nup159/Nup146 N-terminal domain-containing protein n=1 Tax=Asterophora parasitica TaxID=117018 RepID=A0A9P7GA91_9AGAR|nr:hypothetical protein DXG03_002171 [Asterophora parasitica]
MRTDEFTRLVPPQTAQVTIDPAAKDCSSDGFNYPTWRLLNKQERVKLSAKPFQQNPSTFYNLLAVANSKGWFVAATAQEDGSYALISSPLADLRATSKTAKAGDGPFEPKRTLGIQTAKPSYLSFASNDTRLFVASERGELLVFDTTTLFSAGTGSIAPIHQLTSEAGPIQQIVSNPGTEANLVDLVAVVYSSKTVVLFNSNLEVQGGWIAGSPDDDSVPVAVAWSPKGKHIAIGLQSGHILTYPLTNKSSIHKHIPPTAPSPLISLNWLSPGHTFRTSYTASQGTVDPTQHIICVDSKTPTAVYFAPSHPFPLPERPTQSFTLSLPKWDEDAAGATEPKCLVVIGDRVSVDLEVLGSVGTQWYQQSQENPLSLPLDGNIEDTVLLALAADLTDAEAAVPVMLAYLNDGTLQAWHAEHSKPYLGIVTPQSAATVGQSSLGQPAAFGKPVQTSSQPVFGSSGFGQQQASAFGQAAAPATTSAFGGATTTSAFGQPQSTSAFGQPSAFGGGGSTSAFGGSSSTAGAFGSGSTFGSNATNTFGGGPSSGAFGGGSSPNAFGGGSFGASTTTNAFGGGAFSSLNNGLNTKNTFGQPSFGFGGGASPATAAPAPDMSREASMSDSTPSLGGIALGESNDPSKPVKSGGIFGSLPPASTSTTSSFSGGPIKPATGFGAFNNTPPPTTTAPSDQQPATTTSPFLTAPKPAPGSGQSSFGTSSFGQPGFGQTAFGKPAVAAITAPVSGGFGAFASAPASFSTAATQPASSTGSAFGVKSSAPTGSFGSLPPSSLPAFGSTATAPAASTAPTPASAFGAFGSSTPSGLGSAFPQASKASPFSGSPREKSPFGSGGSTASAFGGTGFSALSFGPHPGARATSPTRQMPLTPSKPPTDSPSSSPESTPRFGETSIVADNDGSPPVSSAPQASTTPASSPFGNYTAPSTGAFGNIQTSPSAFKPATGFGAFGGDITPASSPFFKAPTEQKTPPVSAFASALASPPITKATTTPTSLAFGASSPLGGVRSAFPLATISPPPAKTPTTGGFEAFSGSSSGFGAFAGPKKSFGELLKTGESDSTDPVKPKIGTTASDPPKQEGKPKPVSAFPPIAKGASGSVFSPSAPNNEESKEGSSSEKVQGVESRPSSSDERSFGNLSLLSEASSFAEVEREESDNDVRSGSDDADGEAQVDYDEEGSFLSEGSEDEEGELTSESEESSQLSDVPEEEEGEEGEEVLAPTDPTVVPLPESRSASATPQPEVPEIKVTPSPPPEKNREESTTPPGSPKKEPSPPLTRPASAPASSTSTPFGLGLGRPSTRPTRSSPLASVPVSLADEDEVLPSSEKPSALPQPRLSPLPVKVPLKPEEEDKASSLRPSRPQTPPLLSAFGTKKAEAPSAVNPTLPKPPVPAPPSAGFSLFGTLPWPTAGAAPPTVSPAGQLAPAPFNLGGFSLKGKAPEQLTSFTPPTQASATPPENMFDSGPAASMPPPSFPSTAHTALASSPPFNLSGFGLQGKTPATPGTSPQAPVTSPPFNASGFRLKDKQPAGITPLPSAAATPQGPTEAGMQRECVIVVDSMNEELLHLGRLVEQRKKQLEIVKTRAGGRQRADLFDIKKWSPARAVMYGEVLVQFEKDLDELRDLRETQRQTIREFQSSMLKANTRKEEISRFNKAKNDKEFARMLKARTLGPEHLETQTQLRRNIRAMRDRIQKLEDHLKGSKKKLAQVKTGQPGLRAPSLDTINRTYRNIDLAIQQQSNDVTLLKTRISKLPLSTPHKAPSPNGTYPASPTRDARLPNPTQRPYNVTPNVAITTAAALNAERAAQNLKRALLAVRKEPLLNTRAASAPPAPLSFSTPQKQATDFFKIPPSTQLFPTTPSPIPGPSTSPVWSMPPDDGNFSPTSSPLMGGRRGATTAKKHNVIAFKKGATPPPPPPPSTFSWGPLPKFDYDKGESFSMVQAVKLTPPGKASGSK